METSPKQRIRTNVLFIAFIFFSRLRGPKNMLRNSQNIRTCYLLYYTIDFDVILPNKENRTGKISERIAKWIVVLQLSIPDTEAKLKGISVECII